MSNILVPNRIKSLNPELISLVAAGEVIEHPASVVKELVENSLDAFASEINVEISDVGLSQIRVADNGLGIHKDDLISSLHRHTTSKMQEASDLAAINTLGFRGEALYSISSVSNISIRSKTIDSVAGFEVISTDASNLEIRPVGMPQGTIVTVKNLFYNVPGRKKYYQNKSHLNRKIIQIITGAALANPTVGFRMKINDKVTLHVPKNQDLSHRISYLLGDSISTNLLPLDFEVDHFHLEGFASKPQGALPSDEFQYIFVNGRPVTHKQISKIIKETYGSLIEVKSHPVFVLNLGIPPSLIDVNVHPRKQEVLFINSASVYENIQKALVEVLGISDLTYSKSSKKAIYADVFEAHKANPHLASSLKDTTLTWNIKTNKQVKDIEILQIHNLYLVFETPQGLTLIDQHAAHERILYEDFLNQFKEEKSKALSVNVDQLLDLPVSLVTLLESSLETLGKLGFTIEHFRNNTFKVVSVPQLYEKHDIKKLLIEFLKDLEENAVLKDSDQASLKTIAYLACRTAIKAGDYLTLEERQNLVEKLTKTKSSYTCPHGRPVQLEISLAELGKMFKRLK